MSVLFWSEWGASNARSLDPKEYGELFYNILWAFIATFAPFDMLFGTLRPQVLRVLHPQLWQNMWSKTLPALNRRCLYRSKAGSILRVRLVGL